MDRKHMNNSLSIAPKEKCIVRALCQDFNRRGRERRDLGPVGRIPHCNFVATRHEKEVTITLPAQGGCQCRLRIED